MKFEMAQEHTDALGRRVKLGDVVVTLDANYKSGGTFEVGIVVGSTPKMLKVATPKRWGKDPGPAISNRNLDKTIVTQEHTILIAAHQQNLSKVREQLAEVNFPNG